MPPKGAGAKGNKKWQGFTSPVEVPPLPKDFLTSKEERMCRLQIKFVTWNYLNFQIRIPVQSPMHIVEQKITEHHGGSISSISLWKDQVHPKNVIRDFNKTAAEIFRFDESSSPLVSMVGGGQDKPQQAVPDFEGVIFYDFIPLQSECPLLIRSPRQSPHAPASTPANGESGALSPPAPEKKS
eukprot:NODE_4819_length_762_cov_13.886396_g4022_i0.p1 GENE.NODE_4819_length_762_cov_13.886396_g4022_i0~~NODE_4819_length_762_cov_13.886396_g4022_i0.p1  ORF type:complete len:183 (+),score=17.41 NODE_4819_length_762_cov_13.886396_g4022_i0:99-647(+)